MKLELKYRINCPACGHPDHKFQSNAFIAPWVLVLAEIPETYSRIGYVLCDKCKSGFFDRAYSEKILEALYSAYRGETYFNVRNSWEPTYSRALNDGLSNSPEWMNWRKQAVNRVLLDSEMDLTKQIIVVDIGGGEGGVIPDFPLGKKYVLDSNKKISLPADINRLEDIAALETLRPDLIMCCGLLEHLNDPISFVKELVKSSPNSRYFYFEVPRGLPLKRNRFISSTWLIWILTKNRSLWNFMVRLDNSLFRKFGIHVLPIKASEHLNFFTDKGLENLINIAGLNLIKISSFSTNTNLPGSSGISFSDAWQVLAKTF